jgi:hypothetical protein
VEFSLYDGEAFLAEWSWAEFNAPPGRLFFGLRRATTVDRDTVSISMLTVHVE